MFKHRLSKFSGVSFLVACLLLVGGSLQSCKDMLDDYKYDDTEPDWLGASIYAFLQEGSENHSYKNYVELIDSLGEKETLNHTGSKTLFVADDKAFERFFANNPWGVKSVKEMSKAQMKILLYNSMFDNAMLLDMMSSVGANEEDEGSCLRRAVSFGPLDTVPVVDGNSFELHSAWPSYNKYWDLLRGTERDEKLHLAFDGTQPMMVQFLGQYLTKNNITVDDINFLFNGNGVSGKEYKKGDAFMYDSKIVSGDVDAGENSDDTLTITCKNGYLYRLDDVLIPPTNMAGELRNRADTKIFSHLLDRFCVPVFDSELTADYRKQYEKNDSIFRLRYFSKNDFTSSELLDNYSPLSDELLNYDPGKNAYANTLGLQQDMAAIFVPKDEHLYEFFAHPDSAGNFLIEYFASEIDVPQNYTPEALPLLLQALDSVPQVNIAAFINNMMKSSFKNSVPSRFDKLTNDANDDMKLKKEDVDSCIIANNGVIYLLNKVFGPAAYSAVSAPTLVYGNLAIMRSIVKQLRYDYYLLAMDANYSFIIPEDENFVYFDPVSFEDVGIPTMYRFHYDAMRPKGDGDVELWADVYKVKRDSLITDTGKSAKREFGPISLTKTAFEGNTFMKNRMTDLLEYLIIVHDSDQDSLVADRKYYSTKGYGTIKVDATDRDNIKFYGGEQIETNTVVVSSRKLKQENGYSYCTKSNLPDEGRRYYSGIPTPPRNSLYKNMKAKAQHTSDPYYQFYQLCMPSATMRVNGEDNNVGLSALLQKYIFPKADDVESDSLKLYSIFYSDYVSADEQGSGSTLSGLFIGVPFFNTYHYTVYVPSNDAITDLINEGFPTWQDVADEAYTHPGRAASLMRFINSFVRYHFQDNSVYCDICDFYVPAPGGGQYKEASFATAVINEKTGRFYETLVKSAAPEGRKTIVVMDEIADPDDVSTWARVDNSNPDNENKVWNVMCRDIVYSSGNPEAEAEGSLPGIQTSSYSVIQPINRALQNGGMRGYDGKFKRFSETGELVDTLTVKGGQGGKAPAEYGGDNCYLVGRCGKHEIKIPEEVSHTGSDTIIVRDVVYLMQPLENDADKTKLSEETFVLKDKQPIMVTADGYLLKTVDEETETTIQFDLLTGEGNKKYVQMLKNDGSLIDKFELSDVAPRQKKQ